MVYSSWSINVKIYQVQPFNYRKQVKNTCFKGAEKPLSKEMLSDLRVFNHHIYEYQKGIRNLILTTEKFEYKEYIESRLKKEGIAYKTDRVSEGKINVYFGEQECVDVVKSFNPNLSNITPEQDFILGIMLGYDRLKQCIRYNKIKRGEIKLGKHPKE